MNNGDVCIKYMCCPWCSFILAYGIKSV